MSSRPGQLLRTLTAVDQPPVDLVRTAAAHALTSLKGATPGHGGTVRWDSDDDLLRFAVDLVAHPNLPDDDARQLIARIAALDTTSGRYAAAAYLTRPHDPTVLAELVRTERRVTVLRHAAARARQPVLLAHLACHPDPDIAVGVARNAHAADADRLTAALSVDRALVAGRKASSPCVMVDELPGRLLDPFARTATSSRLLLHAVRHPDARDHLQPDTAAWVAGILIRRQVQRTRPGGAVVAAVGVDSLVDATVVLAAVGDDALRRRLRTWWGDNVVSPRNRARLHLALRGAPGRWGNWSWDAAVEAASLDPTAAASFSALCHRRLRTPQAWRTMLSLQETFTGTVDQLLTVSSAVASPTA